MWLLKIYSISCDCFSYFYFLVIDEKETMPYVAAHFEQQLELYKTMVGLPYQILF